jgi:ubiquinol-cytochrome c reductase cytochrome b subunit
MRLLKSNVLLRLLNSYLVDSPQPANISYMWNFGSLLGFCLILQILTGVFLAMHYTPNVDMAFSSVEHIMRDVSAGWALRYTHANVASFFFIFVYFHIAKGLYYSSYREPRGLVWTIGVIILVLMMAKMLWPNCFLIDNLNLIFSSLSGKIEVQYYIDLAEFTSLAHLLISSSSFPLLPFNKARTKATLRIGPHDLDVLSIIICGLLGDWWSHKIPSRVGMSVRFQIEQAVSNTAYIHQLALYLYEKGYCASFLPKLIKKHNSFLYKHADTTIDRFNFRLTLFTYSNLVWIHEGFYVNDMSTGKTFKKVPNWISEYITPLGLSHWIMQDGSRKKGQGVAIATNSFSYEDCIFLSEILADKFGLRTSVVKTGKDNQWNISIWKESMEKLRSIISPHFLPEMMYKIK